MNRCALCGRKITNGEFSFGLGCLKKGMYFNANKKCKKLKRRILIK